jgi:VanZ family protein
MVMTGLWFKRWLPALLWSAMIFIGSTDLLSSSNTSRWIEPIVRWVCPGMDSLKLRHTMTIIRKGGHVTEYAILAILLWRAIPKDSTSHANSLWRWPDAAITQGACAFFAMSDEFHQSFIPTRTAAARDVLIDIGGAAVGLTLVWFLCRPWKKRLQLTPAPQPSKNTPTASWHGNTP